MTLAPFLSIKPSLPRKHAENKRRAPRAFSREPFPSPAVNLWQGERHGGVSFFAMGTTIMKFGFGALFAIAVFAMLPGAALAQQNQHPGHPGAPHPAAHAPAMHAPAMRAQSPRFHAAPAMRRPTTHGTVHRTIHRTVRRSTVSRTHHLTRHVQAVHRTHGLRHVRHSARVRALRRNVVASRRFHAGAYRAPRGYRYRRWSYGAFLPRVYWGRDYWITDFLAYGLFAPPAGLVWVRYGPDALLIDEYTGEVIQVDYGVFY
jgi:Ni/Co efflux regulator RcnB